MGTHAFLLTVELFCFASQHPVDVDRKHFADLAGTDGETLAYTTPSGLRTVVSMNEAACYTDSIRTLMCVARTLNIRVLSSQRHAGWGSCVPYVPTSALTKVNLFQRDPTSQISYAPPRKSPVLASLLDDRRLKYSRSDVTGFAASACNVITIPHVSINGRSSFNCYRLEGASVAEAVVPPRRVSRVNRMQVGQWLSAPRTIRLLLLPCLHR